MIPDRTHGDEQRALDPNADQRRPVVAQIDRNQHGHEARVGELEPQRNATHGRRTEWRASRAHDRVIVIIRGRSQCWQ